ncbi:bifunctional UDP-N-acetylglucosamine diphosphorylase/glucosamine-1-phosphate N-acetyltransferase GlmU [Fundicoccus culcitae]|uniref:Bifunctional protein GlmU n=1 Tax=Fundicoccus culcitae TaxID=2969821 RepID=A0ABY5P2W5_9LACT|nr:bifunctional UDP-N-acetylglucosamine diphosphorylase/glucosamine-1-phosphate N-acetyltransferase GlmU [Fundicoccus culcitae]UUX32950.1 bifunctional UDP-N-acetylglucosamine diphosphorylase/glucosamine-1-phosphate N-acetyltransferase GlmU [Fundicoccus culcitae]
MGKRLAVVLAAGKGTRMKSSLPKMLHAINGLSMVEHVIRAVQQSQVEDIVSIVGFGSEQVEAVLGERSTYAYQAEQLGTGHAVLQAKDLLGNKAGSTLVICGDTPLLTSKTLNQLFEAHEQSGSSATILTAIVDDATGYGRVIRDSNQAVVKIVEQKDASETELSVREINTGTYVFDNQKLFAALERVTNNNAQGEYYLPDVVEIMKNDGNLVSAHILEDMEEAIGVNDRVALAKAGQTLTRRINEEHMRNGVTLINPLTTYIEVDVQIGSDTIIEAGVSLKGQTTIGSNCFIGANSEIDSSVVSDNVEIKQSVVEYSHIDEHATVGPFAHLRPKSVIGEAVHIGNFVEVKNSTLGANTKAGHLTYIGDADLGEDINVGCGTIFVNYDGKHKHRSTVGNQAFIGCNANIVSPVNIGKRTFIAAGTTVTKDVEDEALAISRVDQRNIANYWKKLQNK